MNYNRDIIKVGITGQQGFIGTHLFNTLGIFNKQFTRIPFQDSFFDDEEALLEFTEESDVIVHLAAMNRNPDPQVIYQTNIRLVENLISAIDNSESKPSHILYSSSVQEELDNLYGRSKKEGRELLSACALRNNISFTGMLIPNVFGPYGLPYYNSVVATFCYQLTHNEEPKIVNDSVLNLIYVEDLAKYIIDFILSDDGKSCVKTKKIDYAISLKVSELLIILESFRQQYLINNTIPALADSFHIQLFNTFRSNIDLNKFFPVKYKLHIDERGSFIEAIKAVSGGQFSFSTTFPGVVRGNHYHTRKIERFAVLEGHALIQMRKIGTQEVLEFELNGNNPGFIDIPVWYTHNLKNLGDTVLYMIFWINEHYNPEDPDTFFENV